MEQTFGKRGLKGPPAAGPPLGRPAPPRRLRSNGVVVGAIGMIALAFTASAGYREYKCKPPEKDQPDERPKWCHERSHSWRSSSSHGWGFFSGGGSSSSHATFGGFGSHGSSHGGGS